MRFRPNHEGDYGCALHLLLSLLHGDGDGRASGAYGPPLCLPLPRDHGDGGGRANGAYEPSALLHLQSLHPLDDGRVGDHDDSHSRRDLYHRYNDQKEREEARGEYDRN